MLVDELRHAVDFLNQKPPGSRLPTPSMPVHRMLGAAADSLERFQAALEQIVRECDAMNKGPVAVAIAREALKSR